MKFIKYNLWWYILFTLIICAICKYSIGAAEPLYPDIVVSKYIRNYDADTITVNIDDWPAIIGQKISIRVNGIDTPEMSGGNDYSKQLARQAQKFVEALMKSSKVIILKHPQRGKYFRIVADVEIDGKDLGKMLICCGYAKSYDGKSKRPDWSGLIIDPNSNGGDTSVIIN